MKDLQTLLLEEQAYLNNIIRKVEEELRTAPPGHLRLSNNRKKCRYYHCVDDQDGQYILEKNIDLARALAQKSYNLSVLKKAKQRSNQINKIAKDYANNEIEELYNALHKDRKKLVHPVSLTWEQALAQWEEEEYTGKAFAEDTAVIITEKGERVRSKSEKILADYFYHIGIPYKYEKPLHLKGYGTVYPDFTFLSPKTRKEIYWEHDGRMDDPVYARNAVKKINTYIRNGIYPGENLIITYETTHDVLDMRVVEKMVKEYLI